MSRYALRLRPQYGADELTGGERISRGIATALDEYAAHDMQAKASDSARRAQGQVKIGERGGWREGMRRVGDMLGMGDDQPDVAPTVMRQPEVPQRPAMQTPDFNPQARRPVGDQRVPQYDMPVVDDTRRLEPRTAPAAAPRTSIASSLVYEDQDTNGNTWRVDPMRRERATMEMQNDQVDRTRTLSREDEDRKIASLTAAGMPEAEARARVLNGVVRYDETFGQQRTGSGSSLSDKTSFEQLRQKNRLELARMSASGRATSQELARRRLEMQAEENAAERDERRVDNTRADANTALGIANSLDPDTDPVTRATQSEAERAADLARARRADRMRTTADSTARVAREGNAPQQPPARRPLTQQQYDEARKKYPHATIAQSYDISGVRAKP